MGHVINVVNVLHIRWNRSRGEYVDETMCRAIETGVTYKGAANGSNQDHFDGAGLINVSDRVQPNERLLVISYM